MSIWQFQRAVMLRLLAWGTTSVFSGIWLMRLGQFWRGMGSQFAGWGVINTLIALFGGASSSRRMRHHPQALDPDFMDKETRNLTRLLWINTFLDVLYMAGGLSWIFRRKTDSFQRGMGWGVVMQGGFLFFFDLIHAILVPPTRRAWRFWDFSHGEAKNAPPRGADLE
ncbi:MAG: hypothetical protein U0694_14045 [Anaerolineae bacterium]